MFERSEDGAARLSTRGAVAAWVGVALFMVASVAIMLGYVSFGSGKSPVAQGQSNALSSSELQSMSGQSGGDAHEASKATSGDVVMSGRYPVSPEGKLLRPVDTPVPVEPLLPAAAMVESPEGMEAFARYVVDLIPYMWMSGDTSKLEDISMPECSWCTTQIELTNQRTAQGGWIDTISTEILAQSRAIEVPDYPGLWNVNIHVNLSEATGYSGEKLVEQKPIERHMGIQSRFTDGRWMLWAIGEVDR